MKRPYFLAIACAALALAACAPGPLLSAVGPGQAAISPNGDLVDDSVGVSYTLSRDAVVSIYLLDAQGQRYEMRKGEKRPAGRYTLDFRGAYEREDGPVVRQVLPDGPYTYVIEAQDGGGRREAQRGQVIISNGDARPPQLRHVVALPAEISPYDPDLGPQAHVSYGLDKEAWVYLYLKQPNGGRALLAAPARRPPGEYAEVWNGMVRHRYLPDGVYTFVVQAADLAGNVVEAEGQIAISGTQKPDARVVRVSFSPTRLMYGDALKVEITVKNTGPVALRTHGPPPGYTYTTKDTFASVDQGRYLDRRNYWRVGVDWAGGLGPEGARYPYRWGLGKDLAPGEETTVVGYIKILEKYPRMWLYAGLIQEGIGYHVDRVGTQVVEIGY